MKKVEASLRATLQPSTLVQTHKTYTQHTIHILRVKRMTTYTTCTHQHATLTCWPSTRRTQGFDCQGRPHTGRSRPSRNSTVSSPCY